MDWKMFGGRIVDKSVRLWTSLEFIDKFLSWLNYEEIDNGKVRNAPRRLLLEAPKPARRIAEHSLPSPERLCEMAAAYEAKRQRKSEEQYAGFLQVGYEDFVNWVETQVERSAESGGRGLLLTFDHSAGIVVAATAGPREISAPVPYAVPLSPSAVQRLAYATAEHFRKADFRVRVEQIEGNYSRTGGAMAAPCDTVDIYWAEMAA